MPNYFTAKMTGAVDEKFQRQYNYLIDMLNEGYTVEGMVNDQKIRISVNPREGIVASKNGQIQLGFDMDGNAVFAGLISADSGFIGGWTISSSGLSSGTTNATAKGILSGAATAFYAGHLTPTSAPFRVTQAGAVHIQGSVNSKDVKVELSPTNPFKVSMVGVTNYQDWFYITDSSGYSGPNKFVTSKYDVNEDGIVDELDIKLVLDYVLKRNLPGYGAWPDGYPSIARMDVNDSGAVNSADVQEILVNASVRDKITNAAGKQAGVDNTGFWTSPDWGDTKTYRWTW